MELCVTFLMAYTQAYTFAILNSNTTPEIFSIYQVKITFKY